MSKTILAGVLALFLAPGATQTVSAEPPDGTAPGVIQLFGRTLCLADAPAEARCDWRAPAPAPAPADDGLALTLLGTRYCLGDATSCDRAGSADRDETFRFLGMTWCTASGPGCDVVLPTRGEAAPPARDMHASR